MLWIVKLWMRLEDMIYVHIVNGKMIDKNEEIEIFDGDAIMLANEGFEFHICG